MHGQDALFDERFGPDHFQQVALGDELSRIADQNHQQIERFGRQRDRIAAPRQPPLGNFQRELSEFVSLAARHF